MSYHRFFGEPVAIGQEPIDVCVGKFRACSLYEVGLEFVELSESFRRIVKWAAHSRLARLREK